jgi:methylenetetrahydrofolate dehydrogenase (NADP+)/methenyltetrahydrofolate cyclohydrolase
MSGVLIDGAAAARELHGALEREVKALRDSQVAPGLATVLVGDDYASLAYERRVRMLAESVGCHYLSARLDVDAEQADLLSVVGGLNADPRISGVLVLRPLQPQHSEAEIFQTLDPAKDIEAVHPLNAGLLELGRPRFIPSTPASCFHLLDHHLATTAADAAAFYARSCIVVLGRSNNVGKPASLLGMQRGATVVSCDVNTSRAGRLREFTSQADVLIVAVGVPGLIGPDDVKDGAVVIDVGINPVRGDDGRTRMVGDVQPEVLSRASAMTPVPGGVGPITDVWLLHNTVLAAQLRAGAERGDPSRGPTLAWDTDPTR